MDKYVILEKKLFEKTAAFEKRINEQYRKGYRAVNMALGQSGYAVLLEKVS
tara:strand:- start:466 stop:618 length:153 start_codon:yes stop_codon:yes gene_type:complete